MSAGVVLERENITVRYINDVTAAEQAFQEILSTPQEARPIGFDTETAPLPPFKNHKEGGLAPHLSTIRLAQFYPGGSTAYVFDLGVLGLEILRPLFQVPLVAHNAVFELKHLLHAGIQLVDIDCTMLEANALAGGRPSLSDLHEARFGAPLDKSLQKSDWSAPELSDDQVKYAALDAVVAYRLHSLFSGELGNGGLERCYRLMKEAQAAIAQLELNGVHFDTERHADLMVAWELKREEAETRLKAILGAGVNLRSSQQVSDWLEENLDAKTLQNWERTPGGHLSTEARTLARNSRNPLVEPLLAWKQWEKKLSTYGSSYAAHVSPKTGRLHGSFALGGAASGRLSCREPNTQNPPRVPEFRSLFAAPPGRVIVVADYSQIELRVAALISGDRAMLAAYGAGEDLHRKTAAAIAGVPPESVSREQRQLAKAVNFGLLFGQGPRGLAAYAKASYGVSMSVKKAQEARVAFFRAYPELRAWQQRTAADAERTRRSVTPAGRVRDFLQENRDHVYTEAMNTPIQGGAAEVLLATLAILPGMLAPFDAKLVNVVHDEIVLEVADADAEAAKDVLEKAMLAGMLAIFPAASTTGLVEAHIGQNWAEAKG